MQVELQERLKNNPLQNMPVLGFFENYALEKSFTYNQSFILIGTSDYKWAYMAVNNKKDFEVLLEKFNFETLYFANVEEWMLTQLTAMHRIEWKLTTDRYYLPDDVEAEATEKDCRPLNGSHTSYIYQHSPYKDFTSESYLKERLQKDISAGVWINDELVGWGLTHDDSSLGFLNVLPEYRGQGVGEAVFRCLITTRRAEKKPVFVNVEPHNRQSINLLEKVGLIYDRTVSWVKLV